MRMPANKRAVVNKEEIVDKDLPVDTEMVFAVVKLLSKEAKKRDFNGWKNIVHEAYPEMEWESQNRIYQALSFLRGIKWSK